MDDSTREAIRQLGRVVQQLRTALQARPIPQRQAQSIGPLTANTSTDVAITWRRPFPDGNYYVDISLTSGAAGIPALHASVKLGTRTPTGVTVTVTASADVAVVILDVLGWGL